MDFYTQYYTHQSGGGGDYYNDQFLKLQLPRVYQRGRGVGAIFSTIWRFLKPLIKSGVSFMGKEAVNTGVDILHGIANQKPIKQVLKDRSLQVVDKIRDKASNKIKAMSGTGIDKKRRKIIKSRAALKRYQLNTSLRAVQSKTIKKKNNKNKSKKNIKTRIIDIFSK